MHAGIGKSHLAALVVGQSLVQGKAVLLEQVPFAKTAAAHSTGCGIRKVRRYWACRCQQHCLLTGHEARRSFRHFWSIADGTACVERISSSDVACSLLNSGKGDTVYIVDGGLQGALLST